MKNKLATTDQESPNIGAMLSKVLDSGVTSESADTLEKMLSLYERVQAKDAEKQFNTSFSALQNETPEIVASSIIPNRGKYERFEDVMHVLKPLLFKHGFTISFTQEADEKRIRVTCKLAHVGGHAQCNTFGVRLGGKADSEVQSDCKASTTAKRNALLQALNIVVRQDCMQDEDDPHNEPEAAGFITEKEADELRDWLEAVDGDREEFLKYAKADTFFTIQASMLPRLHESLRRKEAANKSK